VKSIIFLFLVIFSSSSIFSDDKNDYSQIKDFIEKGKLDLANKEIEQRPDLKMVDPDLIYLEANVFFSKAEELYRKKDYLGALEYFEKVKKMWPNHENIDERIYNCLLKLNRKIIIKKETEKIHNENDCEKTSDILYSLEDGSNILFQSNCSSLPNKSPARLLSSSIYTVNINNRTEIIFAGSIFDLTWLLVFYGITVIVFFILSRFVYFRVTAQFFAKK
jgi:tetratricopeptide (TPR) repeat protein